MADYSEEIVDGLNVALNEATLLGVEFNREENFIAATFAPIAIDENGEVPYDRVQFIFKPIGRFIASYRLGRWDDKSAPTIQFEPQQILEKVLEFGGSAIYGWEFIDTKEDKDYCWLDRLSFDFNSENDQGKQHSIELFQDGGNKHIDIKIWFDSFIIYTQDYDRVELQTFISNGKRAWDGINNSTASSTFGIYPLDEHAFSQLTKNIVKDSGPITKGQKRQIILINKPQFYGRLIMLLTVLILSGLLIYATKNFDDAPIGGIIFLGAVLVLFLLMMFTLMLLQLFLLPTGVEIDYENKTLTLRYLFSKPLTFLPGELSDFYSILIPTKSSSYEGIVVKDCEGKEYILSNANLENYKPIKVFLEDSKVEFVGHKKFSFISYFVRYFTT